MFYVASFISDRRNRLHRRSVANRKRTVRGWRAGTDSCVFPSATKSSFAGNFFGTNPTRRTIDAQNANGTDTGNKNVPHASGYQQKSASRYHNSRRYRPERKINNKQTFERLKIPDYFRTTLLDGWIFYFCCYRRIYTVRIIIVRFFLFSLFLMKIRRKVSVFKCFVSDLVFSRIGCLR